MSDMSATVTKTEDGFAVSGYEKLSYDFCFLDGVFKPQNGQLADCYRKWGRVLTVLDKNMKAMYGAEIENYFKHHDLPVTFHSMPVGEKAKTITTLLGIVDAMTEFGIIRKEPVLVVGGGLVTDVAGFACACYRRNSNFIRVPTTVIGLIDASVSIKVAVNYGRYKNRLGAYHAPIRTMLDFTFLRTLPIAQVRNGFAEIIKISSCADLNTFNLLDAHCEELIETKFGRADGASPRIKEIADRICEDAIHVMLKLESPNLHEIGLDRIIAYGHTWSPLHELTPDTPLRHGHAISIDMAYSATLAMEKGLLSKYDHARLIRLFSRAGLSTDHPLFDNAILEKGTAAILKTRDGQLRLAVPSPLGSCKFVNDYTLEDLERVLKVHKKVVYGYPRHGEGLEAFVDASDTGESAANEKAIENGIKSVAKEEMQTMNGNHGNGDLGSELADKLGESKVNEGKNKGMNGAVGVSHAVNGLSNGHA